MPIGQYDSIFNRGSRVVGTGGYAQRRQPAAQSYGGGNSYGLANGQGGFFTGQAQPQQQSYGLPALQYQQPNYQSPGLQQQYQQDGNEGVFFPRPARPTRQQGNESGFFMQRNQTTPHFGLSAGDKDLLRQRIAQSRATQFTAPYENDPTASPTTNFQAANTHNRANFLHQYNSRMGQAMQAGTPGMGLMRDEDAAQAGNYRTMPNVTVGGAYGRQNSYDNTDLLHSLLGLNGQGGTVSGGVTDPGTLGALRKRMPAPWMQGGGQMAQGGGGLPALEGMNPQALAMSRQNRAMNSGGRLLANPGGANSGNYYAPNSKDEQFNQPAFNRGGIDAAAMVQANPDALYGFSPEHQRSILESTPGAREAIAQRQQAYRDRQQQAQTLPMMQALGLADYSPRQQRGMERGQARQERIAARKAGPSQMDQLLQRNPAAAIQAMEAQNRNQALAVQLGILNRQADQGDERNNLEGRKLTQADQQFNKRLLAQTFGALVQGGMDQEEAMAQAIGLLGDGQPSRSSVVPKVVVSTRRSSGATS